MSKQTTTDFDKKLKQALSDDPTEAIQALHNGGYPLCKYQKVLSAVSELVEECIPEKYKLEEDGVRFRETKDTFNDGYNTAVDEIYQRFREKLGI